MEARERVREMGRARKKRGRDTGESTFWERDRGREHSCIRHSIVDIKYIIEFSSDCCDLNNGVSHSIVNIQ